MLNTLAAAFSIHKESVCVFIAEGVGVGVKVQSLTLPMS